MSTNQRSALLVGADETETKLWSAVAVFLLLLSGSYFAMIQIVGFPNIHFVLWWEGFAALLVALVAVQAYSNDGVVVSWGLATAATVGTVINYGGIGITADPPTMVELLGIAAVGGLVGGVVFGTLGFVIGRGLRTITSGGR